VGIYTEHWNNHVRKSKRDAFVMILYLVVGLPATVAIAYLVGRLDAGYRDVAQIVLLAGWLVAFTTHLVRVNRIVCPRCSTIYSQGKWQRRCPSCALPILQESP
jgi:hypothetical protein